jgi:transposase
VDKPRKKPGRPRHDDHRLSSGVIWILRAGAPWQAMPAGFGPKSTHHARFQEWLQTGALAVRTVVIAAQVDLHVHRMTLRMGMALQNRSLAAITWVRTVELPGASLSATLGWERPTRRETPVSLRAP